MVVVVQAQVPTVTFLLILNAGAIKGAYMSRFVENGEEDFICTVVLYAHKLL